MQNLLKEPGGIELNGTSIDINKIKVPTYFISTREDHITPWKSTYEGAKLMSGPIRFVLGGSGHIAGIINPPIKTNTVSGLTTRLKKTRTNGWKMPFIQKAPGGPIGING